MSNKKENETIEVVDSENGKRVEVELPTKKDPKQVNKERKKNKKTKTLIIALACLILVVGIVAAIFIVVNPLKKVEEPKQQEVIVEPEKKEDDKLTKYKKLWKENKAINSDYLGQLVFESGLIDQPVLQGSDNDIYFRSNWKDMSYDAEGSVFMDYRNEPDDQNLIIYGHYVYPEYEINTLGREKALGDRMFTPLVKLKDQANYEANKYVDLYLENEVIRYEVAVVYHCILDPEVGYVSPIKGMYYFSTNYSEEGFEEYKNTIYDAAFYQTGVDINYNDKLLTLQTCVEGHDELLEIVVCKEISRTAY